MSVGLGGDVCGLARIGRSVGVVSVGLTAGYGAGDVVGDSCDSLKLEEIVMSRNGIDNGVCDRKAGGHEGYGMLRVRGGRSWRGLGFLLGIAACVSWALFSTGVVVALVIRGEPLLTAVMGYVWFMTLPVSLAAAVGMWRDFQRLGR